MAAATDSSPDSSGFIYGSTFAIAAVLAVVIAALITFMGGNPYFKYMLWLGFPMIAYMLSVAASAVGQWLTCKAVNVAAIFKNSLTIVAGILISLGISSLTLPRVIVGSLLASTLAPKAASIEQAEAAAPIIKGFSYAYYVFWGALFGQITTANMAVVC